MSDLDDLARMERLDSLDVLGTIERFHDQFHQAWEIGRAVEALPDALGIDGIVVLGMGGSGVAGDVVRAVIEPRLPIPYAVLKHAPPLPEWIGRNSLVFAVSYSGNTDETLAALDAAHERGARVVTVSSGGQMAVAAIDYGTAHIAVPGGQPPRASLAYLAVPLLAALGKMGLIPDTRADVDETVPLLANLVERCHRKRAVSDNPAKALAARVAGTVPVLYGAHGLPATVAYRWKCDLNEYAKQHAFSNVIPEMDHNELMGWEGNPAFTKRHLVAAFLRDAEEDESVARRVDATRDIVRTRAADCFEIRAEGGSRLARLFHLITLTQFASIYAAFLNGVDPGPVETIERLKSILAVDDEGASI